MEVVSLKMEKSMLDEIDSSLEANHYATRTEFIRDCIREKLSELEVKRRMEGLSKLRGSLKGKIKRLSKDELDKLAKESFRTGRDGFKEIGL